MTGSEKGAKMNLIVTENYENMSRVAAMELMGKIVEGKEKRVNLSVTGGKTPVRMYEIIREFLKDNRFENVHYYNFDEIPVKGGSGLTMDTLRRLFFQPCRIDEAQIDVFDEKNYMHYDKKLEEDGGIDMIMLGLGPDGHFCGNLSGTLNGFGEGCRAVSNHLNERIEKRLAFLSGGMDKMADYYVTFGPATVMGCKKIVMIVSGMEKAEILKKVLEGPICEEIPSSLLRLHPDFTVIADKDAVSLLGKK